ncbi:hypothetical protein HMPREF9370_1702 [Neisseria wadsworthii 9715]|uniref:Uncharacterized protein n=1 Tax=Neisseria wadsworthii 9715 TaxID=1030841 RepID=G4CRJ2_9NEIS|nr:hypothetical protein HMPREF9370_1702 [Neisseria wadsworthii 9715]
MKLWNSYIKPTQHNACLKNNFFRQAFLLFLSQINFISAETQ